MCHDATVSKHNEKQNKTSVVAKSAAWSGFQPFVGGARCIGRDAAAGRTRPLWAFVRRLTGKSSSCGPRRVPVMKRTDGPPAKSADEVALVWRAKFAEAFGNSDCVQSAVHRKTIAERDSSKTVAQRALLHKFSLTKAKPSFLVAKHPQTLQSNRQFISVCA